MLHLMQQVFAPFWAHHLGGLSLFNIDSQLGHLLLLCRAYSRQKGWQLTQIAASCIVSTVLLGCSSKVSTIDIPPLASDDIYHMQIAANLPEQDYRVEPGDTLKIRYPYHPEMDQEAIVRPDGQITATLAEEIMVAGKTTREIRKLLIAQTGEYLRDPVVLVSVTGFAPKNVYVAGEVKRPGAISYHPGLSPLQAVISVGGFLDTAKIDDVILIRVVAGDELIARKLNLEETLVGNTQRSLPLAPHDVVFVPKTAIASAGVWVEQHITQLFPFIRGAGANYRIPL